MEFPEIGVSCSVSICNQLDFLPLRCQCDKFFCPEHFKQHSHECKTDNVVTDLKTIDNIFQCSEPSCKDRTIVPLLCEKCRKHYCIKHRHIGECVKKTEEEFKLIREKLNEPTQRFNEAKAVVDRQVTKNIEDAKKSLKKREMACKIQLMRLKNKATGLKSVPSSDRIYFKIISPHNKNESAVFVSKNWSVGKIIDVIADELKLINYNNKSGEKKLRLFKESDKTIVSKNMADNCEELLNSLTLLNGEIGRAHV